MNAPVLALIAGAMLMPALASAEESQSKESKQSEYAECMAAQNEARMAHQQAMVQQATADPDNKFAADRMQIYRVDEYDRAVVDYRPTTSMGYVVSGLGAQMTLRMVQECRQYQEKSKPRYRVGGIKSPTYRQASNKKRADEERSTEDSSAAE